MYSPVGIKVFFNSSGISFSVITSAVFFNLTELAFSQKYSLSPALFLTCATLLKLLFGKLFSYTNINLPFLSCDSFCCSFIPPLITFLASFQTSFTLFTSFFGRYHMNKMKANHNGLYEARGNVWAVSNGSKILK